MIVEATKSARTSSGDVSNRFASAAQTPAIQRPRRGRTRPAIAMA
jgi:hypothetical protein